MIHCCNVCGCELKTMVDQGNGRCAKCRARGKDEEKRVNVYGRIEDFADADLVDELVRRGWISGGRIRRGHQQTTLRAPLDHERKN